MPSRWTFLRYLRQHMIVITVNTITVNDANGAITYNHILSEHFGMSHSSITFSTD